MKTIDQLTKTEKSLLLFLECAAVDHTGIYRRESTNAEDRELMDTWRDQGFINHGRVASKWLKEGRTVWATLSPEAFKLAHQLREERALRMWGNKNYVTTHEYRAASPDNHRITNDEKCDALDKVGNSWGFFSSPNACDQTRAEDGS